MIKEEKKEIFLKIICYVIFMIYFLFLIKIILFKYISLGGLVEQIVSGNLNGFRSINLIPLNSIIEFAKTLSGGDFFRGFNNIVGNMFVFAPLGWFLPMLIPKCNKIGLVILAGFIISFLFEGCQYLFYLGSADIDDIILNLTGTLIGFLFYRMINKYTKEKAVLKYIVTIIFSIFGFAIAGYFAIDYFGIMFGAKNSYDEPVNVFLSTI